MSVFIIKDATGAEVNRINADLAFVQSQYEHYEEYVEPVAPEPTQAELDAQKESQERQWRDSELERTDTLALLPDYPQAEALLVYRQALRDWTDSEDFPNVKPTLGE